MEQPDGRPQLRRGHGQFEHERPRASGNPAHRARRTTGFDPADSLGHFTDHREQQDEDRPHGARDKGPSAGPHHAVFCNAALRTRHHREPLLPRDLHGRRQFDRCLPSDDRLAADKPRCGSGQDQCRTRSEDLRRRRRSRWRRGSRGGCRGLGRNRRRVRGDRPQPDILGTQRRGLLRQRREGRH